MSLSGFRKCDLENVSNYYLLVSTVWSSEDMIRLLGKEWIQGAALPWPSGLFPAIYCILAYSQDNDDVHET